MGSLSPLESGATESDSLVSATKEGEIGVPEYLALKIVKECGRQRLLTLNTSQD